MGFNIYFAGADATRKTTLAYRLRDYLRDRMGREAIVQSFPSEVGVATGLIRQHINQRMVFDYRTLAVLFAADRLETSEWKLEKIRKENPDAIFIFDRGPLDGKVYAAASAPEGGNPVSIIRWMDDCDSVFFEKYPVGVGFILMSSIKSSKRRMDERSVFKKKDKFDSDMGLQVMVRQIFDGLELGREWHRIGVSPGGSLTREANLITTIVGNRLQEERIVLEGVGVGRER